MKIDEGSIDHNALMVIDRYMGTVIEYADAEESADHIRVATLGYIEGVNALAKALKEVLTL